MRIWFDHESLSHPKRCEIAYPRPSYARTLTKEGLEYWLSLLTQAKRICEEAATETNWSSEQKRNKKEDKKKK